MEFGIFGGALGFRLEGLGAFSSWSVASQNGDSFLGVQRGHTF